MLAYVGIAHIVLNDFILVQPATVAIMKSLREIPVIERLSKKRQPRTHN
jgi:hypothetical protein